MSTAKVSNVGLLQSLWDATTGSFYSDDTALKYLSAINVHENVSGHTLEYLTVSAAPGYMELANFVVDGKNEAIPKELAFLPALVYFDIMGNASHLLRYKLPKQPSVQIPTVKIRGLDPECGKVVPSGAMFNKLRESRKRYYLDRGLVTYAGLSGPYWKWVVAEEGLLTTEGSPDVHQNDAIFVSMPSLHLKVDLSRNQLRDLLDLSVKYKAKHFGVQGGYGRSLILKYLITSGCLAISDEVNFHFAEYPLMMRDVVTTFKKLYMLKGQRIIEGADDEGKLYIAHSNFSGDDVFKAADDLWRSKYGRESSSIYQALRTGSSKAVLTRLANIAAHEAVRLNLAPSSASLFSRVESYFKSTVRAKVRHVETNPAGDIKTREENGYATRLTKAIMGDYRIGKSTAIDFYNSFASRIKLEGQDKNRTRYANGASTLLSIERG